MKYGIRRWISLFMTAVLILTGISTDIYAATGQAAENLQLAGPIVTKMSASRLEDLAGTDAVYFGTASAELTEADAFYSLPVYREGDLSEEASVSLLTLDVSALYGSDYELCLDSVFEAGGDQTLLQKGNGENAIVSSDVQDSGEDTEGSSGEDGEDAETSGNGSAAESGSGSGMGDITGSLLSEYGLTEEEIKEEMVQEAMSAANVDFSAGTVLHFAPGEDEKTITFRLMEDELEEGQEMFQFILADAVGMTPKEQYTFTAVIDDNEELHSALVSFSNESYSSEDGKVTVTVNRTGSDYSMIDFYLQSSGDTAEAGVNYAEFAELISMQPYQSSASYTFDVYGSGSMNVILLPNTGCEVEGSDIAQVLIGEETETLVQASETGDNDVQVKEFKLKIGDDTTNYRVRYSGNAEDLTIAGIYKQGYEGSGLPRVGDYVFVNEKTTRFGFHDGDKPTTWLSEYQNIDHDGEKSRGYLYWRSKVAWDEGDSSMVTKNDSTFSLGTTHYRTITPNCEGKHSRGLNQRYEFFMDSGLPYPLASQTRQWDAGNSGGGDFEKNVDSRFKFDVLYMMDNAKITLKAKAADRSKFITSVGLYVYGYVCMYKAFDVRMSALTTLKYKTAGGSTLESQPFRLQMKAGVGHTLAADDYRTVYADSTGEQSKLTFSPTDVYLNGHSGVFGNIIGYEMTYNCDKTTSEEFAVVKYPQDFFAYLKKKSESPAIAGHNEIDYTTEAVEKRIKQAQEDLRTIDFDEYLVDWMTSLELDLKNHDLSQGDTAKKLSFTPIFEYKPSRVTIQMPTGSSEDAPLGKFTKLKTGIYENEYHIGDELNLTAEAEKAGYIAAGYEYTTDNGLTWNKVVGEDKLFLTVDMGEVVIRPLMTTETNKIRFELIGDAAQLLELQNIIPEEDLEDTEYEGMLLYDANPDKSNIQERARPQVGQNYPISVIVKEEAEEGYTYRPYFIDKMYNSGTRINSQVYPLIAKVEEADNVIKIGVEKVKTSELTKRTVTGLVQMKPMRSIRETGQAEKYTPVVGYHLSAASGQEKVGKEQKTIIKMIEGETDYKGQYTLQDLTAKTGDVIPVLISEGYGGEQTGYITIGSDANVTAKDIKIRYPILAPTVSSIMYSYGDAQHNIDWDTNQATIKIYEDDLEFQIVVDENGREVGNVYVCIKQYDGTIVDWPATRKAGNKEAGESDVWVRKLEGLPAKVRPGAKVYIRIEDKEQISIGTGKKAPIIYPSMDTGLTFLFSTDPVLPQFYEAKLDPDDEKVDIPLFGRGAQQSGATTGLCNLESLTWPTGGGYTLSINLGATINPLDPKASYQKAALAERVTRLIENKGLSNEHAQYLAAEGVGKEDAKLKYDNLEAQVLAARKLRAAQAVDKVDPKGDAWEPYMSVDIAALISIYFVKVGSSYRYQAGTVILGGTFTGDFTKYKLWGGVVPGYLNFGFYLQVAWIGAWTVPDGTTGIDVNAFKKIDKNLKESIKGTSKTKETSGMVFFIITGYGGAGVGSKGFCSIKGTVDLTWNIGVPAPKTELNKKTGVLVSVAGGFTLNTFITDIHIDIVRFEKGLGAWAGYKTWQVCGALIPTSPKPFSRNDLTDELERMAALRDLKELSKDGNEVTSVMETLAGTASMEVFGQLRDGAPFDRDSDSIYAYPSTLLADAADYPRVQSVVTSDEGDLFVTFIGNRGDNGTVMSDEKNREALYYTTYQAATDTWSTPDLIDDDGSFDTAPVLNLEETAAGVKLVTVTWSTAEEPWTESVTTIEKMSTLRVKTMKYFIDSDGSAAPVDGTMIYLSGKKATSSDAEKTVEKDPDSEKYFDVPINTWQVGESLYSLLMRYDVSKIEKEADILDLTKTRPAVWLAEYDTESGVLVRLDDLGLTSGESLLISADAELLDVEGGNKYAKGDVIFDGKPSVDKVFLAIAYTQDTDGNVSTDKDSDLKLCYVEIVPSEEIFVYPAISVSEGGVTDAAISLPDITVIDGEYYLSYLKNGSQFEITELGHYAESMFAYDYLADLYKGKAEKIGGGEEASSELWEGTTDWYAVTVEELNKAWKEFYGEDDTWTDKWPDTKDPVKYQEELDKLTKIVIPSCTEDDPIGKGAYFLPIFEESDLASISKGEFRTDETGFCTENGQKTSVSEYQVVSDEKNLYIIYPDFPEYRLAPEKELFCIKMEKSVDVGGESGEMLWSAPVQLTDARRVLDGFTAVMEDGEIVVISNGYTQTVPDEGGIIYSENSLVETRYTPSSIIRIDESSIGGTYAFNAEETGKESITVSYSVANIGLTPQQGYSTRVEDQNGKIIFEADMRTKGTPTIGELTEDMLSAGYAEASSDEEYMDELLEETAETEPTRQLSNGEGDSFTFSWCPENYGVGQSLKFIVTDASGERDSAELKIEEVKKREFYYAYAQWEQNGARAYVTVQNNGNVETEATNLILTHVNDEGNVLKTYTSEAVPALSPGESCDIELFFEPENEDFNTNGAVALKAAFEDGSESMTFYYCPGDPSSLEIENGKDRVYLTVRETRTLTAAAQPLQEEAAEILYTSSDPSVVSVAEDGTITAKKFGVATITAYNPRWALSDTIQVVVSNYSDDDGGQTSNLPSYVDKDGTWRQDQNGNWTYTTKAGVKVKDRWIAIACATFGKGSGFEWFRFDKDGNMVTGWFRDSDDRMYYLQVVSDGNKGRMLTDWQKIDKDWYYFETVSNGYKGSMYRNQKTRDNYYVGNDGKWDGKPAQK